MATRVKESFVRCRYLDMKMEGQKMAPLPDRITIPCPCFTHLGIDLAGPFQIKIRPGARRLRGNRSTIKAWVIVIVCLSTKAVKLYTAAGLSTQDFLLAYLEHTSDCGVPLTCHSDRGTNLVRAAKDIEDGDLPDYNFDEISK